MKNKSKPKKKCKVSGCNNIMIVVKHGLCNTHIKQLYSKGKVTNKPPRRYKKHDVVKLED